MRLLIAIMLLVAMQSLCSAQEHSKIAGKVSEKLSGEAAIGVSVMLFKEGNPKPTYGANTNKFGFYSIPQVLPGEYLLKIKGIGYEEFTKKISLEARQELRLDAEINTKDIQTEEITVTAEKDVSATERISTIKIDPSFIAKMPAFGGEIDVFRSLQLLPGIKQSTEISSGLYVRGGSPEQNLTLLDGVIVYNPSHLGGFLSVFNNDALRDIKMIKGAFPAEYGGRLSSVLDMTMKEGTKEKLSGSAGISLISSRMTLEGPINENSTFMISGRRMYLDILLALVPDGEDAPTYYFYDLNAKVNYKLSDNDHVYLSGFFARDVLKAPESEKDNFDIHWGNITGNARWMHIVSADLFTNFSLIYTNYNFSTTIEEEEVSDNFTSTSEIKDVTVRGEATYYYTKEHNFKFGFESTYHNFFSSASTGLDDWIDAQLFPSKELSALEVAFFAQDEWKVTDKLSTNIGLRSFYFNKGNYFNIEPRLSASYKIADETSLTASFATANQFLHLIVRNDITLPTDMWFPSTEKIKPASSWQAVLGMETFFKDREYKFSTEIYYKGMNNLYEYKDTSYFSFGIPLENQFTSGEGVAYGFELFFNKQIGDFTGWIGYTLAWTKRRFSELNRGEWFSPRYDRRHDVSFVVAYKLSDSWQVGATWVYGTGQAYTMPTGTYSFGDYSELYNYSKRNDERLPSFHKLDLNLTNDFTWFSLPFQFSINIYNVYNQKNPFAWVINDDWDNATQTSKKVLKQYTLFPIIPTFGLSCKF